MCCGGLWQEILDLETAVILDQDDRGTLPKTGSIGGVILVVATDITWAFEFVFRLEPG